MSPKVGDTLPLIGLFGEDALCVVDGIDHDGNIFVVMWDPDGTERHALYPPSKEGERR